LPGRGSGAGRPVMSSVYGGGAQEKKLGKFSWGGNEKSGGALTVLREKLLGAKPRLRSLRAAKARKPGNGK